LDNRDKIPVLGALTGKRIVVTRAPDQAAELIRALESRGATVLALPTVSFAPPEDAKDFDAALARLAEFDWTLFTSPNAVRFFCRRWRELGNDSATLGSLRGRVAAVGTATAQAAEAEEMRVDYIAQTQTGESLGFELRDSMSGKKVLLPRSDRVDDRLPSALCEAGALVSEVVAYRTLCPQTLDKQILTQIRSAQVDAIVFASASAFQNTATFIPVAELVALSERVRFATIGPSTTRALQEAGVRVAIESNDASSAGLVDAIDKYYQRQTPTERQP
jgi:uroporphyrinogen-III synthase